MAATKPDARAVRKFGVTFCVILLIISALSYYKNTALWEWTIVLAAFFLITGLFIQVLLRPVYAGWMKFAAALGWFNTRLILGVVFYLIFTPIGVVMRVLGKDALKLRIDKNARTYWIRKERKPFDRKRYERLF